MLTRHFVTRLVMAGTVLASIAVVGGQKDPLAAADFIGCSVSGPPDGPSTSAAPGPAPSAGS